jgi:hypothetical protein
MRPNSTGEFNEDPALAGGAKTIVDKKIRAVLSFFHVPARHCFSLKQGYPPEDGYSKGDELQAARGLVLNHCLKP